MVQERRESVKERCRSQQENRDQHMRALLCKREVRKMQEMALEERKRRMIVAKTRYAVLVSYIFLQKILFKSREMWQVRR